ncbi:unnamed protein product [Allacma fusca]|uniref:Uncharacterized protein n=1 Tax=Allacma fusca TaxID=39272 RepID=A0A8J2KMQ7_9HEXA|nr:unnamed protein product [Allacma fusca]
MPRRRVDSPSSDQKSEIMAKLKGGATQKNVAAMFGVKLHVVSKIWKKSRDGTEGQGSSTEEPVLNGVSSTLGSAKKRKSSEIESASGKNDDDGSSRFKFVCDSLIGIVSLPGLVQYERFPSPQKKIYRNPEQSGVEIFGFMDHVPSPNVLHTWG